MVFPRRIPGTRARLLALVAAVIVVVVSAVPATAKPQPGFLTSQGAMLTALTPGARVTPIISVGDTIGSYRFESIPDGISILPQNKDSVAVFVNHETSTVPFPVATSAAGWMPTNNGNGSQSDFENSQLSLLTLNPKNAGVLSASYAIPSSANYQRFCSNFLATAEQGFDRPILFTNEEATDFVFRTGQAYPAPVTEPPAEQAGVVVAYDVLAQTYRSIYGMGRHNHENSVAIPGYDDLVLLSGDDTFSAPSSQLYSYVAADTASVLNDTGTLYAFQSTMPDTVNDYGDVTVAGGAISGRFIPVDPAIARGPQTPLETWSNDNDVFQFIRVEDIAYDRNNPRIVYIADTGEPRARQGANPGPDRLNRGPGGTEGPYPNGRIWKMTLNATDPLVVDSLEVLIDADAAGYRVASALHNPDNLETTKKSLLIQEDPGAHNQTISGARVWRYDLSSGSLVPVAEVNQSADGGATDEDGFANGVAGTWESSGIVDVSSAFGPGTFLVTIQAHTLWVDKQPSADNNTWQSATPPAYRTGPDGHTDWMFKREGGQLVLLRIPGA